MDKIDIEAIAKHVASRFPADVNGAARADIYAFLGKELGLTHLLLPDARPDQLYTIDLPKAAPELYRNRQDRSETAAAFIARVYKPWLGKGLAQHHLRHLDHALYHALHNWLKKNPMPEWLDLPTKKELNDRELRHLGLKEGETLPYPSYYTGLKTKLRLYNAARNRAKISDEN